MTPPTLVDLENVLMDVYSQQCDLYDSLLTATSALEDGAVADSRVEMILGEIHRIMDRIAESDRMSAGARRQWQELSGGAVGAFAQILREVESRIVLALEKIQRVEEATRAAKDRLQPQLSAESRRRQMVSAYGRGRSGIEA